MCKCFGNFVFLFGWNFICVVRILCLTLPQTILLNKIESMNESVKDTEQLILESAIKEFSAKGFDGARTTAIAAAAGVTHAMLHYYFRTKEKLFERIFKDKIEQIMNMVVMPIVMSKGNLKERIRQVVEAHFDFLMQNRELPVFFITTLNSRPELYDEACRRLFSTADARIGALQAEVDAAAGRGEVASVEVAPLLADIASLNVMPFLSCKIMMSMMGYSPDRFEEFMADRKKENVETIIKRIS